MIVKLRSIEEVEQKFKLPSNDLCAGSELLAIYPIKEALTVIPHAEYDTLTRDSLRIFEREARIGLDWTVRHAILMNRFKRTVAQGVPVAEIEQAMMTAVALHFLLHVAKGHALSHTREDELLCEPPFSWVPGVLAEWLQPCKVSGIPADDLNWA